MHQALIYVISIFLSGLAFMIFYRDWILKYFLGNHLAEDCYRQDALKVG